MIEESYVRSERLPFPASVTAKASASGTWEYTWTEQRFSNATGVYTDADPARSGDATDGTAYELNNLEIDVPCFVWMRYKGVVGGVNVYEFTAPADALSTPVPSLTVTTVDGTPSYADIGTLRFDETDGFVITNPATGIARVNLAAAEETQAGIVSTTTQTFGGDKYFPDDIGTNNATITGLMSCTTGSAGTFAVGGDLTSGKHTVACPGDFGTTVVEWMKFNYNGIAGVTVAEITHGPVISSGAQILIRTFNPGLGSVLEIGAFIDGRFDISKGDYSGASDPVYSCRGLPGVDITEAGVTYTGGIRTGGTLAVDGGTW